jgi:hypothetical protein
VWMGHDLEDLRELRGTMVGTERGLWERDGLPELVEARLESAITQERRRATVRKYLSDLGKILGEVSRVLRPGGVAYLVLGPTIIATKRTDAARLMTEIGDSVGLSTIGDVVRDLPPVRRSLPPPSLAAKNDMGLRMRREVIVALRKMP